MVPASVGDPYTYADGGRDNAFILREGVEVRGGYTAAGENIDETTRKSRFTQFGTTTSTYQAVLSGDIGTSGLNTDNTYHVVLGVNIAANSGTILDGLTISGGYNTNTDTGDITVDTRTITRRYGGGIYNHGSSLGLTNVSVRGNTGGERAGGMYNEDSSLVLTRVTVSDNAAIGTVSNAGGGMFNEQSSLILTDVSISDNRTTTSGMSNGAGMFNNVSSLVMINGLISNNATPSNGGAGGIGNGGSGSSTVLINVIISGNSARDGGGMINQEGSVVLTNVVITGNTVSQKGGGMSNDGGPVMLTNVTIAGNYANYLGGGIYNQGNASPHIKNSTIWGNNTGIANDTGSVPVIAHSIVQGSGGSGGGWVTATGTDDGNNLDADPLLSDLQQASSGSPTTLGGYSLSSTSSPAYNAGANANYPDTWAKWQTLIGPVGLITDETAYNTYVRDALQKDAAGNPRFNGALDMGAYEY
jgi:hypothetical protein